MLQIGDQFNHIFRYTQEDVNLFAKSFRDVNPLHIDAEAGKKQVFWTKHYSRIFLGGSVLLKFLVHSGKQMAMFI